MDKRSRAKVLLLIPKTLAESPDGSGFVSVLYVGHYFGHKNGLASSGHHLAKVVKPNGVRFMNLSHTVRLGSGSTFRNHLVPREI